MVAGDVAEDDDPAVGLGARLGEELHPGGLHALVAGVEVLDAQEEPDPTGVLPAERRERGAAAERWLVTAIFGAEVRRRLWAFYRSTVRPRASA